MKSKETIIALPLDEKSRDALAERARGNGRSLGREAATIVKKAVARKAGNALR